MHNASPDLEIIANRFDSVTIATRKVYFESRVLISDGQVAQFRQSLQVFQNRSEFLDGTSEVYRENIQETFTLQGRLLLRRGETFDGLEWSESCDGRIDVEADVGAGSSLGNFVEGAMDLIL